MQSYLEARAGLLRMIDPAAMGRFRVLIFGRGVPVDADIPGLRPVIDPMATGGPAPEGRDEGRAEPQGAAD
jgi:hypothetical protein